jgi:aminoacrylate hydrolase
MRNLPKRWHIRQQHWTGNVPESIAEVPCTIQALLAQHDLLLPTHLARPTLGDTPVHLIADAGHSIHWDAPDEVASHLVAFIAKHEKTLP